MFQHGRLRICHKQFFFGRIDCALRPSFDRADGVCNAVAKDISRLSDEELKQKLEFIMGPPEEPDPEELVYSGPSIQELAEQFNKEPFIHVGEGPGGFPFIRLRHDSGAEAMVHLHGGTVSSWTDADGLEMLFVHPDNDFDPRYPIRYDAINEMKIANGGDWLYDKQIKGISTQLCRRRGGLQTVFPQYAAGLPGFNHRNTLPPNGFLGSQHFTLLASHCIDIDLEQDACPGVTMHFASTPETEEVFPHQWEMLYQVNLMDRDDSPAEGDEGRMTTSEAEADFARAAEKMSPPKKPARGKKKAREEAEDDEDEGDNAEEARPTQLQICMTITNNGETEFQFQAASIADFAVKDMNEHHDSVRLVGLGNRHALELSDSRKTEIIFNDMPFTHPIPLPEKSLNRVFVNTNDGDVYFCPGNRQYYSYVWRQGYSDTVVAHPGVFSDWMTCLARAGAGKIAVPVVLKPGESWHAEFAFRKHYHYWPTLPFEDYGTPAPDVPIMLEE